MGLCMALEIGFETEYLQTASDGALETTFVLAMDVIAGEIVLVPVSTRSSA
jgi:hypothetical protein